MTTENSGDRLRKCLDEKGLSPTYFAAQMDVSNQTLNNWFRRGVPAARQVDVARRLGVEFHWLRSGDGERDIQGLPLSNDGEVDRRSNAEYIGPIEVWDNNTPLDSDEVSVPFLKEVELSAGSGKTVVEESPSQRLRFGKLTLRRQNIQPSDVVCVTVRGNSMEPVLPDKSTVGIDQGSTSIVDGKMYAINHGGQLRVKTLYRLPGGGIRIRSYNRDEHPDEEYSVQQMNDQEIVILGRVFWSSALW
ncbi:LexA family transcriptional regulator [Pseudomonas typographi]|uniref:Helix-turn-helix transcriptional regulator n=1 Tax=Pseudomonas typographi TaxID=2715964 RepID=A0ABR7Z9B4_9PSED|nr:helix-turn-helix transcriptional regulator [Pseudomonas typographi]MBD1601953.1 helix-turn-helix transcriptional regulator [Pseudomonas typographi]